ncbi:unnamed protein product [Didymodactylos carnosus]|uniref:Uncharacterized protein n=1 Tax=Didymodactylos carnosus TaxID=1234261 RepID=A0A814VNL7_9BILA|nr:unnamed protein product [Didymodactylos carnosus]CAF3957810.1 unnamed protein product [Didymodactylos carnosus]
MENIALSDSADDLSSNIRSVPHVHDEQQVTSELHDAATTDVKSVLPQVKSLSLSDTSGTSIQPSNIFKSENKTNPLLFQPSSMSGLPNPLLFQSTSSRLPLSTVTLTSNAGIASGPIGGLNLFQPPTTEIPTRPLSTGNSAFTPLQPSSSVQSKFNIGDQSTLRAPTMPSTLPFIRPIHQSANTNMFPPISAQNTSSLSHLETTSSVQPTFKSAMPFSNNVTALPTAMSSPSVGTTLPPPSTMSTVPLMNQPPAPENNTNIMTSINTTESVFSMPSPSVPTFSSIPTVGNLTTQMQSHAPPPPPHSTTTIGASVNPFSARASLTERIYPSMTAHTQNQQQPWSNLAPYQSPLQQHFVPSQVINTSPNSG